MWSAALVSVLTTIAVLLIAFRRSLSGPTAAAREPQPARLGVGAVAVLVSTVLVLALASPAVPVLVVGIAAIAVARTARARVQAAVDVRVLGLLFVVATVLGGLGRWWGGLASLLNSLSGWETGVFAALAAVGLNNLPAAVLLTPHPPLHGGALLIGLNIGPNLAVTGSLSALLWLRVARIARRAPVVRRPTRASASCSLR